MRIGIIGSGISGLTAAWLLSRQHEVVLYEADDYLGGHTHTVDVSLNGRAYAIDTGFIVCNELTYPNFLSLLRQLKVSTQASDMSFSVHCERSGFEYAGTSLDSFFAQRRNLLRLASYRLLLDIVRFNRRAKQAVRTGEGAGMPMSAFCAELRVSREFLQYYLEPMLSAIWSADPSDVAKFPAVHFLRFFDNHKLLDLGNRPTWRVIQGGSRSYVEPITAPVREIRLRTPVQRVRRTAETIEVREEGGHTDFFDHVVLAVHSDQALALLEAPTRPEREVLGDMRYQENDVVLHTDTHLLPRDPRAWASWNYRITGATSSRATVTYNMNRLQSLNAEETFCVTLNQTASIDPARVLGRYNYWHPVYNEAVIAAQQRHAEISGADRIHYCGAYWGYGFHEDGVNSALAACTALGVRGL